MENLFDLFARYDGPLPRDENRVTGRACWEMLLSGHLRGMRLRRRTGGLCCPHEERETALRLRRKILQSIDSCPFVV